MSQQLFTDPDASMAPPHVRAVPLLLGLAVLAAAWLGPLPGWASQAFVAHMTMHVSVVAVAAPLLALGVAGTCWDPARQRPAWFAPLPASFIELAVVWAWHAPGLHDAARGGGAILALEQGMFVAAGLLVWLSAFGGEPRQRRVRGAAGIGGLLMTSMHMTLLGALLALAPRPLYEHGHGAAFGWSALDDQHWGGVLMLLGGGTVYLAGGLYLLWQLLRAPRTLERGC